MSALTRLLHTVCVVLLNHKCTKYELSVSFCHLSNIHCIPSLKLFWTDVRDGPEKPGWNPAFTEVERNIIIANYGGSQGFDNDDGSSWYDIHHNVIYGEGLKQDCKLFDCTPTRI